MIVAGIDGGTRSGLAIFDGQQLLHAESHRPKGETDGQIFHGLRAWLRPLLVDKQVEYVAVEQPLRTDLSAASDDDGAADLGGFRGRSKTKKPIGNMRTFLRLYGIRAHILELCQALNVPLIEVNNVTWRSAIYGPTIRPPKGHAGNRSEWWKQHALEHCRRVGWPITSKDAAESACSGDWCVRCHLRLAQLSRPGDLFADQNKVPALAAGTP